MSPTRISGWWPRKNNQASFISGLILSLTWSLTCWRKRSGGARLTDSIKGGNPTSRQFPPTPVQVVGVHPNNGGQVRVLPGDGGQAR
jgi:hypothetical protein